MDDVELVEIHNVAKVFFGYEVQIPVFLKTSRFFPEKIGSNESKIFVRFPFELGTLERNLYLSVHYFSEIYRYKNGLGLYRPAIAGGIVAAAVVSARYDKLSEMMQYLVSISDPSMMSKTSPTYYEAINFVFHYACQKKYGLRTYCELDSEPVIVYSSLTGEEIRLLYAWLDEIGKQISD